MEQIAEEQMAPISMMTRECGRKNLMKQREIIEFPKSRALEQK